MTAKRWLIETTSGAHYLIDTGVQPHGSTHLLRWPGVPSQDVSGIAPNSGDRVVLDAEPVVGEPLVFRDPDLLDGRPGRSTAVVRVTALPTPVPPSFVTVLEEGQDTEDAPVDKVLPTWTEITAQDEGGSAAGPAHTGRPSPPETPDAQTQAILSEAAASPTVHRTRRRLS